MVELLIITMGRFIMNNIDLIIRIIALIPPLFTLALTLKKQKRERSDPTSPSGAIQTVNAYAGNYGTNNIQQNQIINSHNNTTHNHYHSNQQASSSPVADIIGTGIVIFILLGIVALTYVHFKTTILIAIASFVITGLISKLGDVPNLKNILITLLYLIGTIITYIICINNFFAPFDYSVYFQDLLTATSGQIKIFGSNDGCMYYIVIQILSLALLAIPGITDFLNSIKNVAKKARKRPIESYFFVFSIIVLIILDTLLYLLIYQWNIIII